MAQLSTFPMCCGASVLCHFDNGAGVQDPFAVSGWKSDGHNYIRDAKGALIGITYADKFKADLEKLRSSYPNRMYCAILNQRQYDAHDNGWPKLLKEVGFQFVCRWSNSQHDGSFGGKSNSNAEHPNYLFVLCTDGTGSCKDHTRPPTGWAELPTGVQASPALKAA